MTEVPGLPPLILLALKRRPKWQVGKWNGPGGAIETHDALTEHPCDAATRELEEETGLRVDRDQWDRVCTLVAPAFRIYFLKTTLPLGATLLPLLPAEFEPELLKWFEVNNLPDTVIPDLSWLVPFALDGRFVGPEILFNPNQIFAGARPRTGGKDTD